MSYQKWKAIGPHHITLRSNNLAASKEFYSNILGFEIILNKDNLFIVSAPNIAIAVRGPEENTSSLDTFDPFRVGLDHFALAVEESFDFEGFAEFLKEKGVWYVGPKIDQLLNKKYVALKDPDGIKLEFYQA